MTGAHLFDLCRSDQVTYRLLTNYKVAPYDIPHIVLTFQPNRAELDYPIGLVRCPLYHVDVRRFSMCSMARACF
jgi:hypothetical protein